MSSEETLLATIQSTDLQCVTKDLAEIAIDGFFGESVIRDIPVLGTIISLTKGIMSISDRLFTKKLLLFIYELKDLSMEERNMQIQRIQRDSEYQGSIGEKLLMIIDKFNDSHKASLTGKLFLSCLKNEITYKDFLRCADIISTASLSSLLEIIGSDYTAIPIDQEDDMISSGLFKIEPPTIELVKMENTYANIRYGEDLRTDYKVKDLEWSAVITFHGKLLRTHLRN